MLLWKVGQCFFLVEPAELFRINLLTETTKFYSFFLWLLVHQILNVTYLYSSLKIFLTVVCHMHPLIKLCMMNWPILSYLIHHGHELTTSAALRSSHVQETVVLARTTESTCSLFPLLNCTSTTTYVTMVPATCKRRSPLSSHGKPPSKD